MADHSSNQSRIQITAYGISASPSHFYRLRVATAPSACDLTRRRGFRDTAGTVTSTSVVHLAGLFSCRQIGENVAAVQTRMEEIPGGQHEFAFLVGKKYFERQDFGENWMVVHIKGLIKQIQIVKTEHPKDGHITLKNRSGYDINNLFTTVTEELALLDPQDFDAAVRHEFVSLRVKIRDQYSHGKILNTHRAADEAARMSEILDSYAGAGSGGQTRTFSFITNPDIKNIVFRDYQELTQRAFPDGAWKSSVILAGSILEAVLFDVLTKDAGAIAASMGAPVAPNRPGWAGGGRKDILLTDSANQWTLNDFIRVASHLGIIPAKYEQTIHLSLREYRNLVHPRLELQLGVPLSKAHAGTSVHMLDVILDILK